MTAISDVITGKASPADLQPWQRAGLSMAVYRLSCEILAMPISERKKAGESLPADIRDLVRAECQRIIQYRKSGH